MDFKKLLGYAKLVIHVCNECLQVVNGRDNGKIENYDGALESFNNWTKSGYLDSPEERFKRFRINEKGIREVIEITTEYLRALKKIIRKIPKTELRKLMDELKDFIVYYKANPSLIEYQNNQVNH